MVTIDRKQPTPTPVFKKRKEKTQEKNSTKISKNFIASRNSIMGHSRIISTTLSGNSCGAKFLLLADKFSKTLIIGLPFSQNRCGLNIGVVLLLSCKDISK